MTPFASQTVTTHARRRHFVVLIVLSVLCFGSAEALAREKLSPAGSPESIPLGSKGTIYYRVGDGLTVPVLGPGTLSGYAKLALAGDDAAPMPGTLTFDGFAREPRVLELEFKPSKTAGWSSGRKFAIEIPAGPHDLKLNADADLWVVLYWDGVAQPVSAITQKKPPRKKQAWDFRGALGLGIIYNDNILTAGVDDIENFESGLHPDDYIHDTTDDLVLAPSIELEVRRTFLPWGQTRARGKAKSWLYTHNSVKHNHDFDFYLRQYFGKRQSLELYLHAAPEQYIRQLTDRTPLEDPARPIERKEFRFQRNIWNLTWRQKITRKLDAKALFEKNYRYYNRPFMENDIEAWEIRGQISYDLSRDIVMNIDYSYEDGNGRGIDMVGETLETTDNSDPSYERDLYRFELLLDPPFIKKYVDRLDLTFLYMDYYYTTDKPLVEDPYHVGRRDEFTKFTVACRRKLSKPLTAKLAVRRTERITSSPWEGDLTTDKAFVQWQYWIDLTYRF